VLCGSYRGKINHNKKKIKYRISKENLCKYLSVFGWGNVLRECNVMRKFKYFAVNFIVWMGECNVRLRKCNVMREFKYFEVNCLEF
jgi:hypothetical protein